MSNTDNTNNPLSGLNLGALQNMDIGGMMSNLMKDVDMDKFKSLLSSLNMNNDSMNQIMDVVKPADGGPAKPLDMSQLNNLASNVLKGLDVNKLQSVVSTLPPETTSQLSGALNSVLGGAKPQMPVTPPVNPIPDMAAPAPAPAPEPTPAPAAAPAAAPAQATPVPNASNNLAGMLGGLLSSFQGAGQGQSSLTDLFSKFKPDVDLKSTTAQSALNIGGGVNDLKSQLAALMGSTNMDEATREKFSNSIDSLFSKSMFSFDSLKGGLSGAGLDKLSPMITNLLGSFLSNKK